MSRSFKALILASGRLLTTLAQLIIIATLARLLTRGDYATYRQSFLVLTFAMPVAIMGLDRSLYYFLPNEKDRPRGVLIENLLLLALSGAALGLFIILGGNHLLAAWFNNPGLATTLLILAPFPLFVLPTTALGACLMARDRPLMGIVTGSVTSVLLVDYARLYADGRISEITSLIRRSATKCAVIILPTMMFLMCMAPEVMCLMFGEAYNVSAPVFRVYLLILPVRIMLYGAILQATGNSHHILIQSVICLVANVVLTWFAIQAFGPIGAAYATVLVFYLVLVPYALFATRIAIGVAPLQLFAWRDLLKVALSAVFPAALILGLRNIVPLDGVEGFVRCIIIYSFSLVLAYAMTGIVDIGRLLEATGAGLRRAA